VKQKAGSSAKTIQLPMGTVGMCGTALQSVSLSNIHNQNIVSWELCVGGFLCLAYACLF
jgi:hypothetical protein